MINIGSFKGCHRVISEKKKKKAFMPKMILNSKRMPLTYRPILDWMIIELCGKLIDSIHTPKQHAIANRVTYSNKGSACCSNLFSMLPTNNGHKRG